MKIHAPFAGIVRYHVAPGQQVAAGDTLATVEAIKLEASVPAPGPGTVGEVFRADFSDVLGGDELLELGQ
ncbi:biotin/lipoyl-containing protein [Corynebacterium uterequi]|nr:biotin/lipoyl-containing protein [Corynebacterium uterequi]